MSILKKIELKIKKATDEVDSIRGEISNLERKLWEGVSRINAFGETLFLFSQQNGSGPTEHPLKGLREGSRGYNARVFLREKGHPMPIAEILEATLEQVGTIGTIEQRQSLSAVLSLYAKKGEVFTRPAAGVFGLIEFEENKKEATDTDNETEPSSWMNEEDA